MRCGEPTCPDEATHEVRRVRLLMGKRTAASHASEEFCATHALRVWRQAGYQATVRPLYAVLLDTVGA